MKTVLTGDLGGTKCRFALLAQDLSVHAVRQVPTPTDRAVFLRMLEVELAAIIAADRPVGWEAPAALGIGTAGVITKDADVIGDAPNLPLDGYALADHLERVLGLRTTLINDGRASALGEYRYGHAAGRDPLLCLFFGTGIGIGWVVNERPYEGHTNAAGEVGHVLHLPGGRLCPCGRNGCYEAYCGGGPMVERAAAELGDPGGAAPGKWTVGGIVAAAEHSAAARAILDDARRAAGALVASLCTLLNPGAVVLGGGMLQGWPALRGEIESFVRSWCAAIITTELRFVESKGESDAIFWGAADATGAFA